MMDNRIFVNEAETNLKRLDKPITQMGLYCENQKDTERFCKRVNTFNINNLDRPVAMTIMAYDKGDEICPRPHTKFTLQFKNRQAQSDFWTKG